MWLVFPKGKATVVVTLRFFAAGLVDWMSEPESVALHERQRDCDALEPLSALEPHLMTAECFDRCVD